MVAAKCQSDEREMLTEFQTGERRGRGLSRRRCRQGHDEVDGSSCLDYKTSILAAQILVERPEDRIYDDIAAAGNALLDEAEVGGARFIEAALRRERWGDRRLQSS